MFMLEHIGQAQHYYRVTEDGRFSAWCFYRVNQCRWEFYSLSPWHNTGSGTYYHDERSAHQAVDEYMDRQVPAMKCGEGR